MSDLPPTEKEIFAAIRANPGRFRNLGLVLTVIGALAILFPLVASIAIKVWIGWVFLLIGAFVLWHAFQSRDWGSALPSGLIGVLNLAIGVYLAFFPLTGLIGLTFLMGIGFLIQGALEAAIGLQHRPGRGWGWMAISGAASVILGVLLVAGLPGTAEWAVGMMFGLNALTSGLSFLALSRGR